MRLLGAVLAVAVGFAGGAVGARELAAHPHVAAAAATTAAADGEPAVVRSILRPGRILLSLRNDATKRIRIAQVIVDDAYVDFRVPSREVAPGASAELTVAYPWVAGEAYDIGLLLSSGAIVSYELDAPAAE